MNDYTKELKNIELFFETNSVEDKLNVAEELLLVYIGIINGSDVAFMDELEQKVDGVVDDFELFTEEYTLETGAVIITLLQDIAESINTQDGETIQNNTSKIAKEIVYFLGDDNVSSLQNVVKYYQAEYKSFSQNNSFNVQASEIVKTLEENSQLITLDSSKIANVPEDKQYAIIAMILQEVYMIMGIIELSNRNAREDMFSQEEYDDEDFDIKEKMAETIAKVKNRDEDIYEKADFAYSPTDKIVCNICHNFYAPSGIQRHVGSCSKKYVESDNSNNSSYLVKISDKYMQDYFLHVLISDEAQLYHLDTFLRDIWLECCGHMSSFRQGHDELEMDDYVECLTHTKKTQYTYDFGSSTNLIIEFKKEFKGTQEHLIKLVARNSVVKASCHSCDKKDAKFICPECLYGGDETILCKECVSKHVEKYHDSESYMISEFVNSPRTGVCGYGATDIEFK